jgi:hypothetical protein
MGHYDEPQISAKSKKRIASFLTGLNLSLANYNHSSVTSAEYVFSPQRSQTSAGTRSTRKDLPFLFITKGDRHFPWFHRRKRTPHSFFLLIL